jgi:hypothetical protein
MCCNTFPFDICNMFVLFRRQDGESASKGLLSPLLLGGCGWISGWLPGSGKGPNRAHTANPLISGSSHVRLSRFSRGAMARRRFRRRGFRDAGAHGWGQSLSDDGRSHSDARVGYRITACPSWACRLSSCGHRRIEAIRRPQRNRVDSRMALPPVTRAGDVGWSVAPSFLSSQRPRAGRLV